MTRETKIGLLVGLAFIIVIGILLSDHFASTMQPPQTPLIGGTAENVLRGTATPGTAMASSNEVRVNDVKPNRPIDLTGRNPSQDGRADIRVGPSMPRNSNPDQLAGNILGSGNLLSNPDATGSADLNASNLLGGGSSSENPTAGHTSFPGTGSETIGLGDHEQTPGTDNRTAMVGVREYVAEPGDTLSKIAARMMGKNTKANRDAIINANPSLKKDPNRIRAGETYMVPVATPEATAHATSTDAGATTSQPTRPIGGESMYTTKSGDSLWKIANEQVGSPGAIQQIRELNRDVLKNGDSLKPNMKLRLPPKAVASAN